MGDHTYSKTKLGYSIIKHKVIPTKILSILLAMLMVTTIFSSMTLAEDGGDDPIGDGNDGSDENVGKHVEGQSGTFRDLLRDFIQQRRESRKGIFSLMVVTNHNGNEKTTKLRLILPTSIDVDDDGDHDIRVWSFRRPALELIPPAIALKTTLLVRRLPGMEDIKNDSFEIYLEYTPRIISKVTQDQLNRIRIGYQSPEGEEVPKSCLVSHKTIPHFIYPRQKTMHKIGINPLSIAGKSQLNLLFSIARAENDTVNSELLIQVNHSPAIKNEITFSRSKDRFIIRGQTLDIKRSSTGKSNVSVFIKDFGSLGKGSLVVNDIPKKISLSWKLARTGYLKLNSYSAGTGAVKAAVDGLINMGFTPETGIDANISWENLGLRSLTKGKSFNVGFDVDVSMTLSDLYVNALQVEGYKLGLTASLLALNLEAGADVGNLVLTPGIGADTIDIDVTNAELVLEYCVVDVEYVGLPERPTVSITSPEDGDTISGIVSIEGTASAPAGKEIKSVQISIDGADQIVVEGTTDWSYEWDTTSLANGKHTITAISYDDEGGESSPYRVTVTVDNAGNNWRPTVEITSPSKIVDLIVSGVVSIEGTADDIDGDDLSVILQIYNILNKPICGEIEVAVDESGHWSYDWDTTDITAGLYTIDATSYDGEAYSRPDSVTVWVKFKCALDITLSDASIDITNFIVQGELPILGNGSVELASFAGSGTGSLKLTNDSVFVEAEGSLEIQNTSISVTNESGEPIKLLDNLIVNVEGDGNVFFAKSAISLNLNASVYVAADKVLTLKNISFGLIGNISATIAVDESGVVALGGDYEGDYFLVDITDLVIEIEDIISMGAKQILINGTGNVSVVDGQLIVEGDLITCMIDKLYINASVALLSFSGTIDRVKDGTLTVEFTDLFNFNISYDGDTDLTITDAEVKIRSSSGNIATLADSIKINTGGYASLSYYKDELNVTCEVHIHDMEIRHLTLIFNEYSFYKSYINGTYHAVLHLSANIFIETGDDWIKITVGGNRTYIYAIANFDVNGKEGYLVVDIDMEPSNDTIVINVSGIPDDLAIEIDGSLSVLKVRTFKLYLEDTINISIADFTAGGGFGLNVVGGNGSLCINITEGKRIVELGYVHIDIIDLFNMTIQGSVNVSMNASASGVLEVTWNESGNITGFLVDADAYIEVNVTNFYFDYENYNTSANLTLTVDQFLMNGGGDLVIGEDYISFTSKKHSQQQQNDTDCFVLKNFSLNATDILSEGTGIIAKVEFLSMSGDLYINHTGNITIEASADIAGSDIYISTYLDFMEMHLSVDIESLAISGEGGGTITIVDKNISFITGSITDTTIVVKAASLDLLYPGALLLLTLEDLNISFKEGITTITIDLENFAINVELTGNAHVTINTLWIYLFGIEVRLHAVEITGSTTISINLENGMLATIHTDGRITAEAVSLFGMLNLYGVSNEEQPGGSEISLGIDDLGNFLVGLGGSWHADLAIVPMKDPLSGGPLILNDATFDGEMAPAVISFDPYFNWAHFEGAVVEESVISFMIPKHIPLFGGEYLEIILEPGNFMFSFEDLLSAPYHFALFGYAESPIKIKFLSQDEPIVEFVGHVEIDMDCESFDPLPAFIDGTPVNIDVNYINFDGNGKLKLSILGSLGSERWPGFELYLTGGGSLTELDIDGDLNGGFHMECDRTVYFIIPELIMIAGHRVNRTVEWQGLIFSWDGEGERAIWFWINNDWLLVSGEVPPSIGAVTLLPRESEGMIIDIDTIEILPGDKVNFSAWYTPASFFENFASNHRGSQNQGQGSGQQGSQGGGQQQGDGGGSEDYYTFEFEYGDGETYFVDVPYSDDPINIHPEAHNYTQLRTYVANVTVLNDPYADDDATDKVTIEVVDKYLAVDPYLIWDYADVDEGGKLHGSFTVENIANKTYSGNYILNWTMTGHNQIGWGTNWSFDKEYGSLEPGEIDIVNVSFTPPVEPGDYTNNSTIIFNDDNNPDASKDKKLHLYYGLVELLPDGRLILYMEKDEANTFENAFWIWSTRWETLEWEVNDTYSQENTNFTVSYTPDSGIMYLGDPLTPVDLTIIAPNKVGIYYGVIKIERVGDPRDNDTVGITLLVGGQEWVSPDDHIDNDWDYEEYAYDDKTYITKAVFDEPQNGNSDWLKLTLNEPITIKGFRICTLKWPLYDEMKIRIYMDGGYEDFVFTDWKSLQWIYVDFEGITYENVDEVWIRFHEKYFSGYAVRPAKVYEFDFWQAPPSSDLNIDVIYDGDKLFENEPFTVHVTDSGTGHDIPDAIVTYQNVDGSEIYDVKTTNINGEAEFTAIDLSDDIISKTCIVHVEATGSSADSDPFTVYNNLAVIHGCVRDFVTDEGIGNALVVAEPGGYSTHTFNFWILKGLYLLRVPAGTYTINVSKEGYDTAILEDITVERGEYLSRDIYLHPLP